MPFPSGCFNVLWSYMPRSIQSTVLANVWTFTHGNWNKVSKQTYEEDLQSSFCSCTKCVFKCPQHKSKIFEPASVELKVLFEPRWFPSPDLEVWPLCRNTKFITCHQTALLPSAINCSLQTLTMFTTQSAFKDSCSIRAFCLSLSTWSCSWQNGLKFDFVAELWTNPHATFAVSSPDPKRKRILDDTNFMNQASIPQSQFNLQI